MLDQVLIATVVTEEVVPGRWVGMIVGSAVVGTITGLVVLAIKAAVSAANEELLDAEPVIIAIVLMLGAVATVLIVRLLGGRSPATTDRYIEQFHAEEGIDLRHAPGRLGASVTTGASGAPMGLEGPAVYAGSAVATWIWRRIPLLAAVELQTLMVAAAAAGVAAVFKAPVSGAIFALEVPYRREFAHAAVVPALVGSTVGYLVLAVFMGVEPELPVAPSEGSLGYLFAMVLLGLFCGGVARLFASLIRRAEHTATREPDILRGVAAGALLVAMFVLGRVLTGENVAITAGFNAAEWALDPSHSVLLLLGVLGVRVMATGVAVGGGLVGGLFVPLLVLGEIVGAFFANVGGIDDTTLFTIVGGAAFLGAGYGVPITAVVFVAEITGQPGFIIPGAVAVVSAQLVMSNRTVSPAQGEHG